jgi:DNA-binding winged helix-turn-helix (wHTH) protein
VSPPSLTGVPYRFSIFEADPQAGELRKNGVRLKIQDQPFQILLRLLERRGQIVTREELKAALWSSDTFVDFDNGLNMAVKRLREVLGDDADRPIFIETLPRRGYRFIAPVESGNGAMEAPQLPQAPEQRVVAGNKRWTLVTSALCLFGLVAIAIWLTHRPAEVIPRVIDSAQITKDGLPKFNATFKLVTDGTRLYFHEGSLDQTEQNTALMQVAAQGGETARIQISLRNPMAYDFSQIRSELLLGAGELQLPSNERPLWVLPLPAGPPHRLRDIVAHDGCWGPDGRHLAFANGKDVFLAAADGSDVRKLAAADGFDLSYWIRFSPDGKRVRFSVIKFGTPDNQMESSDVMEMAADGSGLHLLPIHGGCCGGWSADGKNYFYQKAGNIWVLPEQQSFFGKVQLGNPVQLTAGPIAYSPPIPSANGEQLFVVGQQRRIELMHYAANSSKWVPSWGASPQGNWKYRRTASG